MDRDASQLADDYAKDPNHEHFLSRFNNILADPHEQDMRSWEELPDDLPPHLFVIGAPRSGTTLLNQLIATHLDVGYVNNLIAAFWRAPLYGIRLSEDLLGRRLQSSLESEHGRTENIREPHEWGYFWSDLLCYDELLEPPERAGDEIDWTRIRKVLGNIAAEFDRAVVSKPFMMAWYLEEVQDILPNACFIWIKRDPLQTALSLVDHRRQFRGGLHHWGSLKPRQYSWLKDEPPHVQIAGQVHYLLENINERVEEVEGDNVLELRYEEVCRSPRSSLNRICSLANENGAKLSTISPEPEPLVPSTRSPSSDPIYERVENALSEVRSQN